MRRANPNPLEARDFLSLVALFAPAIGLVGGLVVLWRTDPRFEWVWPPTHYPVQLYIIAVCGTVAVIGGVADWIYHRLYVAAGPNERRTHLLALATGACPLVVLMTRASVGNDPRPFLVPILVVVFYVTGLGCYDEFVYHIKRCLPLETALHWSTVFGSFIAWLAWMHWCFVRV